MIPKELDETDIKIINALKKNGRISMTDLGRQVYLTTSRLLRLPIPRAGKETIEALTRLCDDRTQALAAAEAAWREAKEESVRRMVGK